MQAPEADSTSLAFRFSIDNQNSTISAIAEKGQLRKHRRQCFFLNCDWCDEGVDMILGWLVDGGGWQGLDSEFGVDDGCGFLLSQECPAGCLAMV